MTVLEWTVGELFQNIFHFFKTHINQLVAHVWLDKDFLHKGPFTKDVRLTPWEEGGLRNPDVQLLFECDSIVFPDAGGRGV